VVGIYMQLTGIAIAFDIAMPYSLSVGLPLASWLIYLCDHLLDVSKNAKQQLSARHEFIRSHYKLITALTLMLLSICTSILIIDHHMLLIYAALIMAFFCLVYIGLTFFAPKQWQWLYNKELLVAFVYATSIYIYPAMSMGLSQDIVWGYLLLFATAYVNLLLMSIIEQKDDMKQNRFSWVIILGRSRSINLLRFVMSASITGCAVAIWLTSTTPQALLYAIYCSVMIIHILLHFLYTRNAISAYATRILTEAAFWLPILMAIAWLF
jgi:hypothetical protein